MNTKKIRVAILLILCIFLCSCKKEEKISYDELTQREVGLPYSDWFDSTTGSAKYLDGDSLLVTIYLDDVDSHWSNEDEKLVADNVKVACDYLKEQGAMYGKDVNLIYDTSDESDLSYRISYKETFSGYTQIKKKGDKTDKLISYVREFIKYNIDTEALLKKYNVNSIAYMVFIDGESDKCTAYSYYTYYKEYGDKYYSEFCLINLRWTDGYNVYPDTYAHELLHLFGARDLYYTDEFDGITVDFIDYVAEEYDKDIMLGSATNDYSYSDSIQSEISKITAYYLGWQGYITELEKFPTIKVSYPATFSESKFKEGGNYREYTLPSRKTYVAGSGKYNSSNHKNNQTTMIIMFVISVLMLIRYCALIVQEKKLAKSQPRINYKRDDDIIDNKLSLNEMNKQYMSLWSDDATSSDTDLIRDKDEQ